MTPEELAKRMAEKPEVNQESDRLRAVGELYSDLVRSFSKDPKKFIPDFNLDNVATKEKAQAFGQDLAEPLLGLAIGLTLGIEPFLEEQAVASYIKRRKAAILEGLPAGIEMPTDIKGEGELYSQVEKCGECGHIYANHSNKDKGPCSAFECKCLHFTPGGGHD